jgi:hypothetical protein
LGEYSTNLVTQIPVEKEKKKTFQILFSSAFSPQILSCPPRLLNAPEQVVNLSRSRNPASTGERPLTKETGGTFRDQNILF